MEQKKGKNKRNKIKNNKMQKIFGKIKVQIETEIINKKKIDKTRFRKEEYYV